MQSKYFFSKFKDKTILFRLYGSYESLDAGQTYDALVDLTGGIQEQIDLKKLSYSERSNLWDIIIKSFKNNSIMGCSINVS